MSGREQHDRDVIKAVAEGQNPHTELTKRELLAGMALQGVLSGRPDITAEGAARIARIAVDELLIQLRAR